MSTGQKYGPNAAQPTPTEPKGGLTTQAVNSDQNAAYDAQKRAEHIENLRIEANSLFVSDSTCGPTVKALCTLLEHWILTCYKPSVQRCIHESDLEHEEGILSRGFDVISGLAMIGEHVALIDLYPGKPTNSRE